MMTLRVSAVSKTCQVYKRGDLIVDKWMFIYLFIF
jgi:hypothetical protein